VPDICRASALRVTLAGNPIEPFVANAPGEPCLDDDASLLAPTTVGPVTVSLLTAVTDREEAPQAKAGVTEIVVSDGTSEVVRASILTSEASLACVDGKPALSGSSQVVGAVVAGNAISLPPATEPIVLGPITVAFNEQTTQGNTLTQRALHISGPELDVVVAESVVGYRGNPCKQFMTGGGSAVVNGADVTHGFVLQCPDSAGGDSLTVVGDFGKFKLDTVDQVACELVEEQGTPEGAQASFNTMTGSGSGRCNGKPTQVSWRFTDEGEANTADEVELHLSGGCVLDLAAVLTNGNHQSHG